MTQREPSGLWVPPARHPPTAPAPRRRGSPVLALTLAVVGLLVAAGLALVGVALARYAGHDRMEAVDDDAVLAVVDPACAEVRRLGEQVERPAGDLERRTAQLDAVLEAARPIPGAVLDLDDDVLDGDQPARAWAADWGRVIDALTAYRQALDVDPATAAFRMPATADGSTVTSRMGAAVEGCVLPAGIEALAEDPPRSAAEAERGTVD